MTDQLTIDRKWMNIALALARQAADSGEVPVGAVLVDGQGNMIGQGCNQPISRQDPTAHAEIIALRAGATATGNYRLPNTTLYVTIEPCSMCAGALLHARIERLVFATTEPKAGAVLSKMCLLDQAHHNHRITVSHGVRAEEAMALISNFFAQRRAAGKRQPGVNPDAKRET